MRFASIVAALLLAGCATGGGTVRTARVDYFELDQSKIARVEAVALAHNVKIIWVNPPLIRE